MLSQRTLRDVSARRAPQATARRYRSALRRGMAPMELVLWLPILLMVMALMVIVANGAVWKLRAAFVARDAVWSTRPGRTGDLIPPRFFPPQGVMAVQNHNPIVELDDPRIDHPVVRGPMLGQIRVDRELLNPQKGPRKGVAAMTQPYPMLGKMGRFNLEIQHPLLDDQFRHWEMGIRVTIARRIPFIYELPKADAQFSQQLLDAVLRLLTAPFRPQLRPLDRDEEIFAWYGHYHDFHPRIRPFCSLDVQTVRRDEVNDVIDRIQGSSRPPHPPVSRVMENFFQRMYQEMLQAQTGN